MSQGGNVIVMNFIGLNWDKVGKLYIINRPGVPGVPGLCEN